MLLKSEIPETYPDVEPKVGVVVVAVDVMADGILIGGAVTVIFPEQLEVVVKKGLADSQVKEIKQLLAQQVEENMGMAMMYTLSEAVREYLVENNREGNVRAGCNATASCCAGWHFAILLTLK